MPFGDPCLKHVPIWWIEFLLFEFDTLLSLKKVKKKTNGDDPISTDATTDLDQTMKQKKKQKKKKKKKKRKYGTLFKEKKHKEHKEHKHKKDKKVGFSSTHIYKHFKWHFLIVY